MLEISKREAQALATIASKLDRNHITRKITPDDILDVITHLGMIQLDTISVVSRSHETALWSRLGSYDLDHLTELFTGRRAITEYATHAAAITPTRYLPLLKRTMARHPQDEDYWTKDPHKVDIANRILERIDLEGALGSRHFEKQENAPKLGQWENWFGNKPEREILFVLWAQGRLLISLRDRSFGRWYDLPERVAPDHWDTPAPEDEELNRQVLLHAMRALGVATAPWLTDYWRTGRFAYVSNRDVRRIMPLLEESGEVVPAKIEGIDEQIWLDANLVPVLENLRNRIGWPTKTTILSPFDNLIWNRGRGQLLWDFDLPFEIYVPAAKRRFGYYNMPILHRGKIVGLIDPSLNRKDGVLTIRSIHLLPGVNPTPALAKAVARTLDDFTAFIGGTGWSILQSNPPEFAEEIYRH